MKQGMCLDEQLIKILSQKIISSSDFSFTFLLLFFSFLQKRNLKYRFVVVSILRKKKSEYQRVLIEIYLQAVQFILGATL